MWALGQALLRYYTSKIPEPLSGMGTIAWVAAFAAPQLLVASLLLEDNHWHYIQTAGTAVWVAVFYLGLVMTAFGYTCWYHVLGRYPASQVGPYLLLLPVFSIIGGWLWLGEPLNLQMVIGGGIIVLGVALLIIERLPKPTQARP